MAPYIGNKSLSYSANLFQVLRCSIHHKSGHTAFITVDALREFMDTPFELSLEQQFSLRTFSEQVKDLSQEQAQAFLVDLYRQMIFKEKMYQHFLKQGIGFSS
jgi:Phycobilisome degradation protein nblA